MGSGLSVSSLRDLPCEAVGDLILQCDPKDGSSPPFKAYKRLFIAKGICGTDLAILRNNDELQALLLCVGVEDENHRALISEKLNSTLSLYCSHPFLDQIDGVYHCIDCKNAIIEAMNPARIQREKDLEKRSVEEDARATAMTKQALGNVPDDEANGFLSAHRGVKISFLVGFAKKHNLWHVPTWKVRRDYVLSATEDTRCRYTELPEVRSFVGRAQTFVSHAWGAPFGDMVAAVSEGADEDRFVWIDIFAVRQWPGHSADLEFRSTIRACNSFILVCSSIPEIQNFCTTDLTRLKNMPMSVRMQVSTLRLWCLVELAAAAEQEEVAIIVKYGQVNIGENRATFVCDNEGLSKLQFLVDVSASDASLPCDKHRIISEIKASPGGSAAFNSSVRDVLRGCASASTDSTVHCAACGDAAAVRDLLGFPDSLLLACIGGYLDLVEKLIKAGSNVSLRGEGGITPVMLAAMGGHTTCLKYLLSHGATLDALDDNGKSVLMYAASGGQADCVVAVLETGADCCWTDEDGWSALMVSAACGHHTTVKALLRFGAFADQKDKFGQSALMLAAKSGHGHCVEALLDHTSNVDDVDNDGCSALILAASGGHTEAVENILKYKVDLDLADCGGHTALMAAAACGSLECVAALVSAGCKLDALDAEGCSAYMFATLNKFDDCARLLRC